MICSLFFGGGNPNPPPPSRSPQPPGAPAAGQWIPCLDVAGLELAPYCVSLLSHALLALPGRRVFYKRGAIRPDQMASKRQSYINGVLIQSRGRFVNPPCRQCRTRGMRPFLSCRRAPGHFGGCCGNCKWRDHAASCTANGDVGDNGSSGDDLYGDGGPDAGGGPFVVGKVLVIGRRYAALAWRYMRQYGTGCIFLSLLVSFTNM